MGIKGDISPILGDSADDLSDVPAEFAADARFVKLGVNDGDSALSLRVNVVLVGCVSSDQSFEKKN